MLLAFFLLNYLTFWLIQFIFSYSTAICARALGVPVKLVSVGFGKLFEIKGQRCRYTFGWCPLSASVSFGEIDEIVNDDEIKPVGTPFQRSLLALVGSLSILLIGVILLVIPVIAKSSQVSSVPLAFSQIIPSSLGGLAIQNNPSTIEGQMQFIEQTLGQYLYRIVTFESLEGLGGFMSALLTGSHLALHGWQFWITFVGLMATSGGLVNLLPIPVLNGFAFLTSVFEWLTGLRLPNSVMTPLLYCGLVVNVFVMIRLLLLDFAWLRANLDKTTSFVAIAGVTLLIFATFVRNSNRQEEM